MSSVNGILLLRYFSLLPINMDHWKTITTSLSPNSSFTRPQMSRIHHLVLFQNRNSCCSSVCRSRRHASASPGVVGMGEARRDAAGKINLDTLLSIAEGLCIVPSVVFAVGGIFPEVSKLFRVGLGNTIFMWQFLFLAGAVVIGGLIRQRQWSYYKKVYRENVATPNLGGDLNLIGRIDKVEEDLRSSVKMVKLLSKQLEKLGIRFRIARKSLKQPIAETALLAQKNSEATRLLTLQEDILEKELGEIQKVLFAMQEQQHKQLNLILNVAKAGKLLENTHEDHTDRSV
ncbi:hypothetical protein ZOSMA_96G00190 [Zostera marina]|uniref:Uncharacterized protein n=1 Tax=Zostera marina TaxID=29655 RepID=A0A0K9NK44_ZOSMR|nr:hypothetical protein ZOSMA_96G00190 [Zostera marina]